MEATDFLEVIKKVSAKRGNKVYSLGERLRKAWQQEGRQEGVIIKAINDVLVMHSRNCSIDLIKDVSGFTELEINEKLFLKKKFPEISVEDIYEQKLKK